MISWMLLLGACGLIASDDFAYEVHSSAGEFSFGLDQELVLYPSWNLTGTPTTCVLPAKTTAVVLREMQVVTQAPTLTLERKRQLLGSDYGSVDSLDRAALAGGQPLSFEVPAGAALRMYGKHPEGRGCLMRLADSRVVSAACIPGAPEPKSVHAIQQLKCLETTGWLAKIVGIP